MSEEMEAMLRKALDDVDRKRTKSLEMGLIVAFAVISTLVLLVGWIGYLSDGHAGDVLMVAIWAVVTITVVVVATAFTLAMYIRITITGRILKAIELQSKSTA